MTIILDFFFHDKQLSTLGMDWPFLNIIKDILKKTIANSIHNVEMSETFF